MALFLLKLCHHLEDSNAGIFLGNHSNSDRVTPDRCSRMNHVVPIRSRVSSADRERLLAIGNPAIHFDTLAGRDVGDTITVKLIRGLRTTDERTEEVSATLQALP